jgi:hypothetical protein
MCVEAGVNATIAVVARSQCLRYLGVGLSIVPGFSFPDSRTRIPDFGNYRM